MSYALSQDKCLSLSNIQGQSKRWYKVKLQISKWRNVEKIMFYCGQLA